MLQLTEACAGLIIRSRQCINSKAIPENVHELLDFLSFTSAAEVTDNEAAQ